MSSPEKKKLFELHGLCTFWGRHEAGNLCIMGPSQLKIMGPSQLTSASFYDLIIGGHNFGKLVRRLSFVRWHF